MSSASAVPCREVFDENSIPSAEEISEYAQQIGIDPDSESHLLPLAKEGLMQALPHPWKAYYDEKLQTHYYYNDETKKTQWEHPLDKVYTELVKKARDASTVDDTYASLQELLTSEDNTKHLERLNTRPESDDEGLTTDSEEASPKDPPPPRRLMPLGRPPLAPMRGLEKKLGDTRTSPLRSSVDSTLSLKPGVARSNDSFPKAQKPVLIKQRSEIIDLKMHVVSNEEESFDLLKGPGGSGGGLTLTGRGSAFLRPKPADLPSPDTERSLPLDSTRSEPPRGILRDKQELRPLSASVRAPAPSLEDDRKSVRFQLETAKVETPSPGSNSSSEHNSSIISAARSPQIASKASNTHSIISEILSVKSDVLNVTSDSPSARVKLAPIVLAPLARPVFPPKIPSMEHIEKSSDSDRDSLGNTENLSASPKRRVIRPPPADYIKPDLFQKNFQKIADLVRPGDTDTSPVKTERLAVEKEIRPRSPLIPQMNKISINLMESIESETSIDSPDKEYANLDLNDMDDSKYDKDEFEEPKTKDSDIASVKSSHRDSNTQSNKSAKVARPKALKIEKFRLQNSDSDDSKQSTPKDDSDKASKRSSNRDSDYQSGKIKIEISKPKSLAIEKLKLQSSDSDESKSSNRIKSNPRTDSVDTKRSDTKILSPTTKVSPNISYTDLRSPKEDRNIWSNIKSGLNKAVIAPQMKSSDSNPSLRSLSSPRLDGVVISQGKNPNKDSDNVVVMYQFERQEETVKSPEFKDVTDRNKGDEKRRLENNLQKDLEELRTEYAVKERRWRAEMQDELRQNEEMYKDEKRLRMEEQVEKNRREIEQMLKDLDANHQIAMQAIKSNLQERYAQEVEKEERQHEEKIRELQEELAMRFREKRKDIESENERVLSDLREQLHSTLNQERARLVQENRSTIETLREEHSAKINELRNDYRAEVDRLRGQHACHLQELRARLSARPPDQLGDKYRCLKEKYARLKHDVKMSIERRNKRREMSMTTGSETEKSNSHKAAQSLEKCKEQAEPASVEPAPARTNNNPTIKFNDNETSLSDAHAHKTVNNNDDWRKRDKPQQSQPPLTSPESSATSAPRRAAVAFAEPPRDRRRERQTGAMTDCQDSSDATTVDDKPKDALNGHGRRRCFTRLKSASTSRLNYSPKRGDGWCSPLETLRQQLRKLDDLEEQFPDLAGAANYSLRYPFAELENVHANTPELEFVRHRAVVEREGMRRALCSLRRRRRALRARSPPQEDREATELEVALHRARALLGEKEIRLRHIERALRRADERAAPAAVQEVTTSEASTGSEAEGSAAEAASGAVLRSLRALHADVRDIWRALDGRLAVSPEPSCLAATPTPAPSLRMTLSAQDPTRPDNPDSITERARGLRAWLQTAP